MNNNRRHINYQLSIIILVLMGFLSCNKDSTPAVDTNISKVIVKTTTSTSGDTTTYTIGSLVVTATRTSPCYPSTEVFTFKANISQITDAASVNWYFGDGHIATGKEVQHEYNNAASFVVQIDVKNSKGILTNSATFPLKAWGQQLKPVAIFSAKNDFPENMNYVTFNSASSVNHGSIVNFHWDWEDGTVSNVAAALTRHQFPQAIKDVTYPVKLTITTDAGCTADTTVYVWVPAVYTSVITGDFAAVAQNACTNESFTFTPQATSVPGGSIYYWHWSDGTHDDSGYNAQHTFAYMNDYDVIMYIKYNGRTIYTTHKVVNAKGPNPKPKASFYFTWVKEYTTDVLVSFNSQSTIEHGGMDGFYWDFANGKADNNYNSFTETRYTRGNPGTGTTDYKVRLIVTGNGCADTAYQTVTIPAQ